MNWYFEGTEILEIQNDYVGFVYKIINLLNNKIYIGKKLFQFRKCKKIKGKKKFYLVESDWKEYYGSNKILLADIEKCGTMHFKREILKFCRTKSECTYWEARYQFEYDVLLYPELFYNEWIMCRIKRSNLVNHP